MKVPSNRLLLNKEFKNLTDDEALCICDVGAREELFEPFNQIPGHLLQVIGFEPDAEEAIRLSKKFAGQRKYHPFGLWSKTTKVDLSYAKVAGNSSIHEPNLELLKRTFPAQNWETRIPKEILNLEVKSLDDVHESEPFDCDLLKVDTQGSEFEILIGAKKLLEKVSFVLLETWTYEVHKGQALTGQIMELMNNQGFTLVRINEGAKWYRKPSAELNRLGLPSLIGLDLLFIRNDFSTLAPDTQASKIIRAASLAELYGFPDIALQVLDNKPDHDKIQKARKTILSNWTVSNDPFLFRIVRKIMSFFNWRLTEIGKSEHAPLH